MVRVFVLFLCVFLFFSCFLCFCVFGFVFFCFFVLLCVFCAFLSTQARCGAYRLTSVLREAYAQKDGDAAAWPQRGWRRRAGGHGAPRSVAQAAAGRGGGQERCLCGFLLSLNFVLDLIFIFCLCFQISSF